MLYREEHSSLNRAFHFQNTKWFTFTYYVYITFLLLLQRVLAKAEYKDEESTRLEERERKRGVFLAKEMAFPEDLMYSLVTLVNNIVLYAWNLLTE